jgi:asparagine synthetase B (glutamine-hydrolysing)
MTLSSLSVGYDPLSDLMDITTQALRPSLRRHESNGAKIHIVGYPACDSRSEDKIIIQKLLGAKSIEAFARELDGNFLILIQKDKSLDIITDRFSSRAFYFSSENGRLIGSTSLVGLVRQLGQFVPDQSAFVEFLHFRRVFGDKTYDARCQFLNSASILTCDRNGCRVRKYWQPDYAKRRLGLNDGADRIADGLQKTMRVNCGDADANRRYALFMSGGLDSRALLLAANEKPLCVTTCVRYNNEAEVAQDVAKMMHAPFLFVPQPSTGYDEHVEESVFYGGGQHVLTEAHFIDYGPKVGSEAECFILGLGLDVFLGGLYLPKRPVNWLGREALHFVLNPIKDDLTDTFVRGVKYRLKSSNPWHVIKSVTRDRLRCSVHQSIADVVGQGKALGAGGYDLWEYLHLHNFSRHYSFLMADSIRHWGECKIPALCNDLLDVAISLPAQLKVNSQAYLAALNKLSPDAMKIRNANTNVAAGLPFRQQSMIRAGRIVLKKFGARVRVSPAASERSWPAPRDILHASPVLMAAAKALPDSEFLDVLDMLDRDAVRNKVDDHFEGRTDESILLLMLITLNEFLRQVH